MTVDMARRRKTLARWHRRLALLVSIWLVALAVTGLLINHAHDWGLDRTALPVGLQQSVYGIEDRGGDFCGGARPAELDCSGVFARLTLPTGVLLLAEHSLILLDDSGEMVEMLAASFFGLERLQAVLQEGAQVFLRDTRKTIRTDADLMDWEVLGPGQSRALDAREWTRRDPGPALISWERLLLDLHAGRFMGSLAGYFNDLMAALILVLAFSGIWLHRSKRPGKGNYNGNGNGSGGG